MTRPAVAALRTEWKEIRREYPVGGVPNEFVERLLAALEAPPEPPSYLEPRLLLEKSRDAMVGALYWLNRGEEAAHAMSPTLRAIVRDINEYLERPT